jgi:predicted O-methyltransferase YrrM
MSNTAVGQHLSAMTAAALLLTAGSALASQPQQTALQSSPPIGSAQRAELTGSREVSTLLGEIKAADADQLSVSEEDGRFLRVIAASSGSMRALEIGGATGYSAIWIGLGLRQTGGHLTTIEFDPRRAAAAAAYIKRAGLGDVVTVVTGDAFDKIPKLPGEFDFVFLDAWKRDYKRFLDLVLPRLRPGGVFLAHNVVNKQDEMRDFLAAIQTDPRLLTAIVRPAGEGISLSYRIKQQ